MTRSAMPSPSPLDDLEARVLRFLSRVEGIPDRHGRVFAAGWMMAGVTVLAAGLAMSVLPGPAILVIPLGLTMLAGRFRWARRLVSSGVRLWFRVARRLGRGPQRLLLLAAAVVIVATGAVVAYLLLP